jgi:uncharacterized protein (DUF1330 family)
MAAYIVFVREKPVHNPAEMETYRQKGEGSQEGHAMKPLAVYGALQALEGTPPDGVVILEFPTVAEAKAWYHSPKYSAAAPHRQKAAEYRTFIVEGF